MLVQFILNIMDTFNIIYIWTILCEKDDKISKLIFSVFVSSISCTIMEQLNVNFMFIYIISIIIIKILYKDDLTDIIVGYFLILYIHMILELTLTLIIKNFINDSITQGLIIETIIMIGVIIVSKFKLLNQYAVLKYNTFEKKNNNILIYFVLTFSIYIVVFKFIWNKYNYIIQNNLFVTMAIGSALIVCKVLTYLYMAKTIKEEEKLKVSNEYNPVIDEIVEEIKQRQHDFINYKNTIKGIVNVVDERDVKKSIDKYINNEDIYDDNINSLIYIENVIIRSIIYRNMCRFKKHNINFEYEIENKVLDNKFTYNEISNLLNNLLNNAFEEVIKDECIKKNIQVQIFNRNKISHLIVENNVVNFKNIDLNEIFTRGYSTKGIGTRGYGLHNIQAIVNSHKGNIKVNMQDEKIIFDVFLN